MYPNVEASSSELESGAQLRAYSYRQLLNGQYGLEGSPGGTIRLQNKVNC